MSEYRVQQAVDAFDYRFHCDPCGEMPPGPNPSAAKRRARRHAAANPDHEVWMSHVVVTHLFARKRTPEEPA